MDFQKKMDWATLGALSLIVVLLTTIVIQIFVATGIAEIKANIAMLQDQMKEVQGSLIIRDKTSGGTGNK